MKIFKILFIFLFAIFATFYPATANAKTMLFGGSDHKQYLGCLQCNEFSSDSICNGFGSFGNEFSSKGIFNEYAGFGNEYNSESPWNEYSFSSGVPVLVDENGKFYGYFTINDSRSDAVSFSTSLKNKYKSVNGDLEKVRIGLCKAMGYSG